MTTREFKVTMTTLTQEPTSTKYSSSKKQRLKAVPNALSPHSPMFKEDVENPRQADIAAISAKVGSSSSVLGGYSVGPPIPSVQLNPLPGMQKCT